MNPYLESLKKAVDTGDFNSEAAKKIIQIDKNADNAKGLSLTEEEKAELAKKRLDGTLKENTVVTEEEVLKLNSEYDKKMADVKKEDAVNLQLATLTDIEDMVVASVNDMVSFIKELEDKFKKEFDENDPFFEKLKTKITQTKLKYISFINY
jgi:hypothetical protein